MTHGNQCVKVTNYNRMYLLNDFCVRLKIEVFQLTHSRLSFRQKRLPTYDKLVPRADRPVWVKQQEKEGLE